MTPEKLTRLNKYLSEVGFCSRRKADSLIEEKRVTVNGVIPEMGTKVREQDVIEVDGEVITAAEKEHVYLAFNKPIGIVCTTNPQEKKNIIDFINYPSRIFPIGRLDKPSEGLILLTDDGDIVNKILRARNQHEKEYIVTVNRLLNPDFIDRMSNGVPILDVVTNKCEVEQLSKYVFRIVLTQGLNRQIRRMCEYLSYEIVKLKRIRIMNISLDVPVGQYRQLTQEELSVLQKLTSDSTKTKEASVKNQEQKRLDPSTVKLKDSPRKNKHQQGFQKKKDK